MPSDSNICFNFPSAVEDCGFVDDRPLRRGKDPDRTWTAAWISPAGLPTQLSTFCPYLYHSFVIRPVIHKAPQPLLLLRIKSFIDIIYKNNKEYEVGGTS